MPATVQTLGIDRMSVEDRLALVQEIWDSIALEAERSPLTEAQRQEVDRRLAAHQANPLAAIPWEQVEAEVMARLRQGISRSGCCPKPGPSSLKPPSGTTSSAPGLGVDFVRRVRAVLNSIAADPQRHVAVYGDVRKASVSRFPYVVLYREELGEVIVISVFHTARDPSIWQ